MTDSVKELFKRVEQNFGNAISFSAGNTKIESKQEANTVCTIVTPTKESAPSTFTQSTCNGWEQQSAFTEITYSNPVTLNGVVYNLKAKHRVVTGESDDNYTFTLYQGNKMIAELPKQRTWTSTIFVEYADRAAFKMLQSAMDAAIGDHIIVSVQVPVLEQNVITTPKRLEDVAD